MNDQTLKLPSQHDIEVTQSSQHALMALLKKTEIRKVRLIDDSKKSDEIVVPAYVLQLLADVLAEIACGNAIKVVTVRAELTIQEAANLLNVSKLHVMKLLDESGELLSHKTDRHRRIKLADLMEYKQKREAQSVAAMGELARLEQESGE